MTTIITQFIAALSALLTGLLGLFVDVFDGVVEIFYVSGENGGFTIYGVFLLVSMVIMLIMLAINFVKSLIQRKG